MEKCGWIRDTASGTVLCAGQLWGLKGREESEAAPRFLGRQEGVVFRREQLRVPVWKG